MCIRDRDRAADNITRLQQIIPEQADSLGQLNDQVEEYTLSLIHIYVVRWYKKSC